MATREGRFAHFMGFGRSPSLAAGDPDNSDDGKDKDGKKSRAEGDDKDPKAGDDDGNKGDPDDKDKDGKKSRRAEGDDTDPDADDDDEEMHGKSAAANARRRERARCAAIFASPQAAGNAALACSLAFETTMTRQEALAVLASQPRRAPAADRSSGNPSIGPGGKQSTGAAATQDAWGKAFEAHGVKPAQRALLRG
jgi:hypothetical protein